MGVIAAVVVAAVLLFAAIAKIAQPTSWRAQASGMGVPSSIAIVVPVVELVIGSLLLAQVRRHVLAWFAVGLFVAFSALLARRLAQGQRPPCACFGSLSARPIGPGHLVRNALFIALAVAAATL
jgi:hypothetical protein